MDFVRENLATRVLKTQAIRNLGLVLLGLGAVVMSIAVLLLVQHNEDLDARLECRAVTRDAMDRAIGRGLAAVANDDPEMLQLQADLIVKIAEQDPC